MRVVIMSYHWSLWINMEESRHSLCATHKRTETYRVDRLGHKNLVTKQYGCRLRIANLDHKLIVSHSHSWLLPRGLPCQFWTPGLSKPPACITDATVVAPAVEDILAALARVMSNYCGRHNL
jgi:hypothetical protein